MDEPLVIDVTTELIGERREEWRDGFDVGLRQGATRVMQSDAMAQLAFDLKLHKIVANEMIEAAEQREKLLASWKAEAQWWKEEHDKVHAEYCEFVKMVAKKFLPPP